MGCNLSCMTIASEALRKSYESVLSLGMSGRLQALQRDTGRPRMVTVILVVLVVAVVVVVLVLSLWLLLLLLMSWRCPEASLRSRTSSRGVPRHYPLPQQALRGAQGLLNEHFLRGVPRSGPLNSIADGCFGGAPWSSAPREGVSEGRLRCCSFCFHCFRSEGPMGP